MAFLGFIFFILIFIALFVIISILSVVLRLWKGIRWLRDNIMGRHTTKQQNNHTTKQPNNRQQPKKIIPKEEGEYVDFEEIK